MVLQVLEFIFSSFWTWAGTVVLVGTAGASVTGAFRSVTMRIRG